MPFSPFETTSKIKDPTKKKLTISGMSVFAEDRLRYIEEDENIAFMRELKGLATKDENIFTKVPLDDSTHTRDRASSEESQPEKKGKKKKWHKKFSM